MTEKIRYLLKDVLHRHGVLEKFFEYMNNWKKIIIPVPVKSKCERRTKMERELEQMLQASCGKSITEASNEEI